MSKLVTIYGGSGFVGRYVVRRMAKAGWRVRVAVRKPNEALFVKPYGAVGQVEPVFCNIRSDESVRMAMEGADAVVNCVGLLNERGKNKFDAIHLDGAERIARIAFEGGVERLVHFSAIGADAQSDSQYAKTKAQGEAAVLENFPEAVILRPSVIFGVEDQFFNRFASMSGYGPVLLIVGGHSKFQPVFVDDVAAAAEAAVLDGNVTGVYELGGGEVATLRELIEQMLTVIQRRKLIINLPFFAGRIMGFMLDMLQTISLGLFNNTILTRDQARQLQYDNVVADGAKGLADLGVDSTPMQAVIPDYLWRFRPSGEFASIKDSAKNLKA